MYHVARFHYLLHVIELGNRMIICTNSLVEITIQFKIWFDVCFVNRLATFIPHHHHHHHA